MKLKLKLLWIRLRYSLACFYIDTITTRRDPDLYEDDVWVLWPKLAVKGWHAERRSRWVDWSGWSSRPNFDHRHCHYKMSEGPKGILP